MSISVYISQNPNSRGISPATDLYIHTAISTPEHFTVCHWQDRVNTRHSAILIKSVCCVTGSICFYVN